MFKRFLENRLPDTSFFLFGPRQVGKTTLLKKLQTIFSVNLLDPDEQLTYSKKPNLLTERIDAIGCSGLVFIDEVQRVPQLLDVVQSLMDESRGLIFALSGSSARKLKHGSANLLGGRAVYRTLHPLTPEELGDFFNLEQVLSFGSLPPVSTLLLENNEETARDILRAYVTTYLREEIKEEALVRNLQGFQNFLDVAAAQFAEQVNMSAVSRDCHVSFSTVREYYSILEDTLMGFFLKPFARGERKRMSLAPKFYFFDNGVTRALMGGLRDKPVSYEAGRLFEQWFVQEVVRANEYGQLDFKLSFWRTSHGAEVDLIVERGKNILCAIECKYRESISAADLSGLKSFMENHPGIPVFVAAPVKTAQKTGDVLIAPPTDVLQKLVTM